MTGVSFRFDSIAVKGAEYRVSVSALAGLQFLIRNLSGPQPCCGNKKGRVAPAFLPEHESLRFGVGFPDGVLRNLFGFLSVLFHLRCSLDFRLDLIARGSAFGGQPVCPGTHLNPLLLGQLLFFGRVCRKTGYTTQSED